MRACKVRLEAMLRPGIARYVEIWETGTRGAFALPCGSTTIIYAQFIRSFVTGNETVSDLYDTDSSLARVCACRGMALPYQQFQLLCRSPILVRGAFHRPRHYISQRQRREKISRTMAQRTRPTASVKVLRV